MTDPARAGRITPPPITLPIELPSDPVEREAATWARYMQLCQRWRQVFEQANGETTEIGAAMNRLGSAIQDEAGLSGRYNELVRGFITFSDQLAEVAEQFEHRMKEAERDWRYVLERLAEPERGWIESRRLAEREQWLNER